MINDGVPEKYQEDETHVEVPAGVTAIGENAFFDCQNLTSITLPEGILSIGDGAFEYCGNVKEVILPAGLQTIGKRISGMRFSENYFA